MTAQQFSAEFRQHHRLFLGIAAVIFLFFATMKITGYMAHRDELQTAVAQAQLKADDKVQKAADVQKADDAQQYAQWKKQSDAEVASLKADIQDLKQVLQDQQNKDKSLPPPQLSERINTLIGVPSGYQPDPRVPDGLFVTVPAAQATVSLLDENVANRKTITDLNGVVAQKDADITKKQTLLTDTENQVASCKQSRKDDDAAHKDEVRTIKEKSTNSKMKWGAVGFVLGVALKALVTHGVI